MLIVDEVDDLVVNEKPSLLYNCTDASLTPHYRACYTALLRGEGKPPKLDKAIWDDGLRIKREADAKVKAVHFDRGDRGWAMLEEGPDGTPRLPKVPLSDDWLVYKNYVDFQVSRKQEVGSRKQEAGIRKQEAGSRTRGKQKVVSSKQKVGSSK